MLEHWARATLHKSLIWSNILSLLWVLFPGQIQLKPLSSLFLLKVKIKILRELLHFPKHHPSRQSQLSETSPNSTHKKPMSFNFCGQGKQELNLYQLSHPSSGFTNRKKTVCLTGHHGTLKVLISMPLPPALSLSRGHRTSVWVPALHFPNFVPEV